MALQEGMLSSGGGRTKTSPIPVVRSRRTLDHRVLTSMWAGKMTPLAAFPLLRMDRLLTSRFRVNAEMLETVEILMNAINVRVMAYLVPNLAFPRFSGMDELNRSYTKQPIADGATVTPYFQTGPFTSTGNEVLKSMGKHAKEGATINLAYNEAYNLIWNFRATNRSPDLTPRLLTDQSLAPAFWMHQRFAHIVPDFDQAVLDGEVPLTVVNPEIPLRGIELTGGYTATHSPVGHFRASATTTEVGLGNSPSVAAMVTGNNNPNAAFNAIKSYVNLPAIVAELQEDGVSISLSNFHMAQKTRAFAALRKQFTGLSDDYLIDLLMNGITIPEQDWKQPMLLADRSTIFGMNKRYSSSADDLTASVVNGGTFLDFPITTPLCPTGGIVMIVAEITPEQLFERQLDPYLHVTDQVKLPEFMRDTLDPEKVEVVPNNYVDVDHATPTGTFGYAPLNHVWNSNGPGIGGKFYRPSVDAAFDEDRQRIWAVETANPTLSRDFYLCSTMHYKPFVITNAPPFEIVMRGIASIEGNTVFGRLLIEAGDTSDYDEVMAKIDKGRIDKPGALEADEAAEAEVVGEEA